MMGLLTAVPAKLASFRKLTKKQNEAILWVWIYGLTKGYRVENLRWMIKQMILESGWHGSPLLERNLNPFGMSCTNNVNTTQKGCEILSDGNTNGKYSSIKQAVKDRFLWDEKRFTEPYKYRDQPEYAQKVADRYYPDNASTYFASVSNIRFNPLWTLMIFAIFIPVELFLIFKLVK